MGALCLIAGLLAESGMIRTAFVAIGLLAIAPGFFYLFAVTIWHWKDRYRGNHSDLSGVILLIESSGWFKVVYLFRHIIPDARQSGRYAAVQHEYSSLNQASDASGSAE